MTVSREIALKDFEFWGGAKAVADRLTAQEFDRLEEYFESLEEDFGRVYSETEINDLMWFETDEILFWLDIDEEEFWRREVVREA